MKKSLWLKVFNSQTVWIFDLRVESGIDVPFCINWGFQRRNWLNIQLLTAYLVEKMVSYFLRKKPLHIFETFRTNLLCEYYPYSFMLLSQIFVTQVVKTPTNLSWYSMEGYHKCEIIDGEHSKNGIWEKVEQYYRQKLFEPLSIFVCKSRSPRDRIDLVW